MSIEIKNPITDYQAGDFGSARFTTHKKCFKTTINCYGIIRLVEKKYLLFVDNDDFEYLINRKDFVFEKIIKEI